MLVLTFCRFASSSIAERARSLILKDLVTVFSPLFSGKVAPPIRKRENAHVLRKDFVNLCGVII